MTGTTAAWGFLWFLAGGETLWSAEVSEGRGVSGGGVEFVNVAENRG